MSQSENLGLERETRSKASEEGNGTPLEKNPSALEELLPHCKRNSWFERSDSAVRRQGFCLVHGDRVKVERRTVLGASWRFEQVLHDSEHSSKLNTSFIERLNLIIRYSSAYLCRRMICQMRWKERLEDHLELFRCYYNFIRPHRALKFGLEIRTLAMQAGLVAKRLSFRDVFVAVPERILFVIVFIDAIVELSDSSEQKMAA